MIGALVLAATVAFPAAGTYTYEIDAARGGKYTTTVAIASSADGVTTHETFGAPTVIARTEQHFDSALHERSFAATQVSTGNSLSIAFSDSNATYHVGGKVFQTPLADTDCVLVSDNVLTSAVMLPAVLQASTPGRCTYVLSTSIGTLNGDVVSTPLVHSPRAAPNDAYVMIQFGNVLETVWYDPHTLIPDYIDFGDAGSAMLTNSTVVAPGAAPTDSRP